VGKHIFFNVGETNVWCGLGGHAEMSQRPARRIDLRLRFDIRRRCRSNEPVAKQGWAARPSSSMPC